MYFHPEQINTVYICNTNTLLAADFCPIRGDLSISHLSSGTFSKQRSIQYCKGFFFLKFKDIKMCSEYQAVLLVEPQ